MSWRVWRRKLIAAEHRELIRLCADTNLRYMATTPAGQTEQFPRVRRIYDRLATQGYECAQAWVEGRPPPPHEAWVDAFWWAVASWSASFMSDLLQVSPVYCAQGTETQRLIGRQVSENWYQPHLQFAMYLRPHPAGIIAYNPVKLLHITPGRLVLMHDAKWTSLGVGLAVRWRPLYLVTEGRTLWEALRLSGALRKPQGKEAQYNPIAKAYLQSDLVFLRELFGHFNGQWSDLLTRIIGQFLDSVEAELEEMP